MTFGRPIASAVSVVREILLGNSWWIQVMASAEKRAASSGAIMPG